MRQVRQVSKLRRDRNVKDSLKRELMISDINPIIDSIAARLAHMGLDAYELFSASSAGLTIEIKDGVLDVFVAAENTGLSIRALKDHRLGFGFCTDLSPAVVFALVDRVVQAASESDPDPFVGFPPPPTETMPRLQQFDHRLESIPIKDKINGARRLEAAARSSDPRIKKVRKAAYVETTGRVTILNHTGLKLHYEKTLVSGSILVVAEEGKNAEIGWDYGFSPFFRSLDLESIGRTAAGRAVSMLGARPVRSTQVPAIFPPQVASDVLKVLSASFMADNIQKGKSMLVGRLKEEVFSPHVTILDDGLYPAGIASSPFDDEGSLHRRNLLVSGGILKGFLYDQYTANKEGLVSTGNAGRQGIDSAPSVQATNLYIRPCSVDPAKLISDVDKGVLVTDIMGLHTADPISGDFSVGATGLWIERGETVFPVKGFAISGNLIDLFKNVDAIGNDLRFYGQFGSPTLRVSNLNIAGTDS
ncbi:MAG: TldD/PmbA family protein [Deltaproteobacteria bacterium]|nr:MAG: TldD/PmbA family protein [Deltaproteobacteria bacterium]